MVDRPLDVLEASVGATVRVELKGGETIRGELAGYDQHMNLVLAPSAEDTPSPSVDSVDEGVEDTTVIRGDNVVRIDT